MDTKMSSIQELLDQYRFAVMCELEEFHSLEEAIRKQALLAADDQIKNARESAESYRATIRLAYFMGHQGIEKASLEFQSFLERIKDIHDPVLVEAVLCCHDRGRAALLNDDFEQGKADGDSIPQEDESSTNGGQSDQGENADASEDSPEGVLDMEEYLGGTGAARYYNNQPSSEAFLKCVNAVIQQVPALGEKRINALRMQATTPIDPLALAKIVLPFNFR